MRFIDIASEGEALQRLLMLGYLDAAGRCFNELRKEESVS